MTVKPVYSEYDEMTIDIDWFRKSNWKTLESRQSYRKELTRLRENYYQVQVASVGEGVYDYIELDRGRLREKAVVDMISDYGLELHTEQNFVYLAQDEETARDGANERFSALPDCCASFDTGVEWPVYEVACNSPSAVETEGSQHVTVEDPDPLLNIMWAPFNWRFVAHTPCSFECEESGEMAREIGSIYRDLGLGEEAELLWEWMGQPTTWSGYHAIGKVLNAHMVASSRTGDHWDEKVVVFDEPHDAKSVL